MLSSTLTMQALIPADKLRDYIAYARARCHPELTEPAAAKLVDSYLNLRGVGTSRKASPACLLVDGIRARSGCAGVQKSLTTAVGSAMKCEQV